MQRHWAALILFLTTSAISLAVTGTQHNNNSRTGAQLDEIILTPAAVSHRGMRVKYTASVNGNVDAQPLYVPEVSFPNGRADALYIVTENNSVYAFDAQTGAQKWNRQLLDADPTRRSLPRGSTNPPPTPVIDVSTHNLYILFSTKNQEVDTAETRDKWTNLDRSLDVAYWLVALDLRNGTELRRVRVQASTKRSDGTTLTFDARHQVNHPALLLDHRSLYLAFGSIYAEGSCEYHGWVLRYNAKTFRSQGVFSTTVDWRVGATPFPEGGGIWQGGGGLVADHSGNVYFLVGNAPFDPAHRSYGDSFVKLIPRGDVLVFGGAVAPPEAQLMDDKDLDLGSGGLIVIPGTRLMVGGGKTGTLYLVDGEKMRIKQSFQAFTNTYHPDWTWGCPVPGPSPCPDPGPGVCCPGRDDWGAGPHLHGSPTYWRGSNASSSYFYDWSEKDSLKEFKFNLAKGSFDETPLVAPVRATETLMPGGILSLSARGTAARTGILWALLPTCDPLPASPTQSPCLTSPYGPGRSHVYAFDAETLDPLWDAPFPDELPIMSHHAAPTIADGKLVVATQSGGIVVYELGPPEFPAKLISKRAYQPLSYPRLASVSFQDERAISALPSLRRNELAPPPGQVVLLRARAELNRGFEQLEGIRRSGNKWEAPDGSTLISEETKAAPAPDGAAQPWQLFKVISHQGKGRLSGVTWIQRIDIDAKGGSTYVFYGPVP
jgi:hypothetical protein